MKILSLLFISLSLWAKPHWDEKLIQDEIANVASLINLEDTQSAKMLQETKGLEILRVQVQWDKKENQEHYSLQSISKDWSGTPALYARSTKMDQLGSYRGELVSLQSQKTLYYDSVGTGMEYRLLTRAMSFRFPMPEQDVLFRLWAENPVSGEMEIVLSQKIGPKNAQTIKKIQNKQWLIAEAKKQPALTLTFYAEGYQNGKEQAFLNAVKKIESIINNYPFPMKDHFEIRAVFAHSNTPLDNARNLGLPIPGRDSFLGLYFPYWDDMGRWYNILYPTRDKKFRDGLAQAVYDYPIILVDSSSYWGVGNYNSHTAIPAENISSLQYLFLHEFGHFMGLNEEYHEPAPSRTELTFAPGIYEPWSQNTTFLRDPEKLKWKKFVDAQTSIPTPVRWWSNKIGAYKGGYSSPPGLNHKPSLRCVMDSKPNYCVVCLDAIENKIKFDLGVSL